MFSRLDHDIPAVLFPKDWAESLKQILLNIYGDKCLKDDRTFEVYGFSYPNEVLMIVSFVGMDKNVLPVTINVSADLNNETKTNEIQDDMFDFVGVFFDNFFAQEENEDEIFEDFVLDWEETEFNNKKFFFKITRENIGLTMQANLLLGE
jgi:hypothetical protein